MRGETKRETKTEFTIRFAGITFSARQLGATEAITDSCSGVGRRESIDSDQLRSAPICPFNFFSRVRIELRDIEDSPANV